MLVSKTHKEPSNEELGIKPWPKKYTYPAIFLAGALSWYLGYLAFV